MAIVLDGTDAIGDLGDALNAKLTSSTAASTYLPIAGGKVLQVVGAVRPDSITTTSTSFVTTSLTASITPSSASSKILVMASWQGSKGGEVWSDSGARLFRGTVAGTGIGDARFYNYSTSYGSAVISAGQNIIVLDSPSTTSSQTYTLGINTGAAPMNYNYSGGRLILIEVSA